MTLIRLRRDLLSLDSTLILTQGNPLEIQAVLARHALNRGVYTAIARSENGGPDLIGQVAYKTGTRSARLVFLTPGGGLSSPLLLPLLEDLAEQAGEWGAFHLLGEVDELSPAFEGLRKSGFSVYAWQRIWKLAPIPLSAAQTTPIWLPVAAQDEPAVRSLFLNLVPPLVQSAEPLPNQRLRGLVYRQKGEIMAYVEGTFGPRGLFLHPIVHPDLTEYEQLLCSLMQSLPRLGRPVYLAVRSYQSWLERALSDLPAAEASPRQALLVKHLAKFQRVPLSARLGVEKRSSEVPTASIVNK